MNCATYLTERNIPNRFALDVLYSVLITDMYINDFDI